MADHRDPLVGATRHRRHLRVSDRRRYRRPHRDRQRVRRRGDPQGRRPATACAWTSGPRSGGAGSFSTPWPWTVSASRSRSSSVSSSRGIPGSEPAPRAAQHPPHRRRIRNRSRRGLGVRTPRRDRHGRRARPGQRPGAGRGHWWGDRRGRRRRDRRGCPGGCRRAGLRELGPGQPHVLRRRLRLLREPPHAERGSALVGGRRDLPRQRPRNPHGDPRRSGGARRTPADR